MTWTRGFGSVGPYLSFYNIYIISLKYYKTLTSLPSRGSINSYFNLNDAGCSAVPSSVKCWITSPRPVLKQLSDNVHGRVNRVVLLRAVWSHSRGLSSQRSSKSIAPSQTRKRVAHETGGCPDLLLPTVSTFAPYLITVLIRRVHVEIATITIGENDVYVELKASKWRILTKLKGEEWNATNISWPRETTFDNQSPPQYLARTGSLVLPPS